jgi:lauroyl/myristoyl acyltransferase
VAAKEDFDGAAATAPKLTEERPTRIAADGPTRIETDDPPTPRRTGAKQAIHRAGVVVHSSTWPRRLFPAPVAFRLIEAYAALAQRAGAQPWQEHVTFHRQLLQYTSLAGTEEEIGRRALIEFFECVEMFWRPWLMEDGDIEGIEHYHAARASGRGVLLTFPHFGMPYAMFPIMRRFGIAPWVIASPHHYHDIGDGYDARFAHFARRTYIDLIGPERAIARRRGTTASGAFGPALELLRRGETLGAAFDVVGSLPTPFLGRQVSLASGPPKLAHESGAVVAPFVVRRRGHHSFMQFHPPIDSRDYADASALQAAIAAIMEGWALERPEAVWPLHTQPGGPPLIRGPALADLA